MRKRFKGIRRLLPSSLFGRAFLILVVPMLLSQLWIAYIFYERHWSSVSRNMASPVVGDVVWLYNTYREERERAGSRAALEKTTALGQQLGIGVVVEARPVRSYKKGEGKREFPDLYRELSERLKLPPVITTDAKTRQVHMRVPMGSGMLDFSINRKMVTSPTTVLFMVWMVGSSLLLTLVATLFLRNQVKPIVMLARAAEMLGLGQDVAGFKPRGANEVRRAGRAFMLMAERIRRQVQNRTEMLAGISHDLRTPLARMKLELEMAQMEETTRIALTEDIEEMRRMIDAYLDFASGDAAELAEPADLTLLLADVVAGYRRTGAKLEYVPGVPVVALLRVQAMRRALTNLIDNALRYGGGAATLMLEQSLTFVRIKVIDHGPGIPEAEQENVFKPFTRLEPSRNAHTGGVGLGLSIARGVAQRHGGDVTLENRRDAAGAILGLEVTLRLPRALQIGE